jgi:ribonucleotide monophosphatase NagD (HAD superfamily)
MNKLQETDGGTTKGGAHRTTMGKPSKTIMGTLERQMGKHRKLERGMVSNPHDTNMNGTYNIIIGYPKEQSKKTSGEPSENHWASYCRSLPYTLKVGDMFC